MNIFSVHYEKYHGAVMEKITWCQVDVPRYQIQRIPWYMFKKHGKNVVIDVNT